MMTKSTFMNRFWVKAPRRKMPRPPSENTLKLFALIDAEPGLGKREYSRRVTGKDAVNESLLANLESHGFLVFEDDDGRLWPPRLWKDDPTWWGPGRVWRFE